ncbi:MAG: cytochrome c peroxidase, partial [Elusimicrobiota bacterium]
MLPALFVVASLFGPPASAAPSPGTAREAGDTDAVAWAAYQRIHSDFFDLDAAGKLDPREIELGRQLFFDPRLSGNGAMSCATCHDPSRAWGDALPRGRGLGHKELTRNTPSLLTVHRNIPHPFFWDGRADSIEKAILTALQSRLEMDRDPRLLVVDLSRVPAYNDAFRLLYGPEGISPDRLARAIGAFIKAEIRPGLTPFDRYRTDSTAMTPAAKRGMDLFAGKARCLLCHTGAFFSDDFFHNVGLSPTPGLDDPGRGALVKEKHSHRAFHTPPLRDVTRTGPYMHDGRDKDLASVIEFYDRGGDVHDESQDDLVKPLGLTAVERADLLAFLQALTSPDREARFPVLPPARGPR